MLKRLIFFGVLAALAISANSIIPTLWSKPPDLPLIIKETCTPQCPTVCPNVLGTPVMPMAWPLPTVTPVQVPPGAPPAMPTFGPGYPAPMPGAIGVDFEPRFSPLSSAPGFALPPPLPPLPPPDSPYIPMQGFGLAVDECSTSSKWDKLYQAFGEWVNEQFNDNLEAIAPDVMETLSSMVGTIAEKIGNWVPFATSTESYGDRATIRAGGPQCIPCNPLNVYPTDPTERTNVLIGQLIGQSENLRQPLAGTAIGATTGCVVPPCWGTPVSPALTTTPMQGVPMPPATECLPMPRPSVTITSVQPVPSASDVISTNVRSGLIPIMLATQRNVDIKELQLFESADLGKSWQQIDKITPDKVGFSYFQHGGGEFWYQVVVVTKHGEKVPADITEITKMPPMLKLFFDTDSAPGQVLSSTRPPVPSMPPLSMTPPSAPSSALSQRLEHAGIEFWSGKQLAAQFGTRGPLYGEIVDMVRDGATDDVIVGLVQACGSVYQLNASDIAYLSQNGVGATAINALLATNSPDCRDAESYEARSAQEFYEIAQRCEAKGDLAMARNCYEEAGRVCPISKYGMLAAAKLDRLKANNVASSEAAQGFESSEATEGNRDEQCDADRDQEVQHMMRLGKRYEKAGDLDNAYRCYQDAHLIAASSSPSYLEAFSCMARIDAGKATEQSQGGAEEQEMPTPRRSSYTREELAERDHAKELFSHAESCRRSGDYWTAYGLYQETHLTFPECYYGMRAIERMNEIENRRGSKSGRTQTLLWYGDGR